MKPYKITMPMITVIATLGVAHLSYADRVIQRPSGEFFIVSDYEAAQVFEKNNWGLIILPPTTNKAVNNNLKITKKRVKHKRISGADATKCKERECKPKQNKQHQQKPVTTVESAESIFLRLEQKK